MLRAEAARVIVEVRDDGRGFPEDELAAVFVQSPRSSKRGGQGLGLRICHQIIGRHGGEISLRNEPGKGATFLIWLPVA
jgi:two-component system OmpR family sensor kinase